MRWCCTDATTRSSRSSSRIVAIPGPLPVRELMTASAFAVPRPQMPSTSSPQLRWKSSSARAVSGPKMPSTRPQSKPSLPSSDCSVPTSSPRRFGANNLSGRSPSRHEASTRASHVTSSHVPWSCRPRPRWNARTARRRWAGRTTRPRRRRERTRHPRGDAAGRESPRRVVQGSGNGNQKFVELLQQLGLASCSDDPLAQVAVGEDEQRRDALHAIAEDQLRVVVGVDLGNGDLVRRARWRSRRGLGRSPGTARTTRPRNRRRLACRRSECARRTYSSTDSRFLRPCAASLCARVRKRTNPTEVQQRRPARHSRGGAGGPQRSSGRR